MSTKTRKKPGPKPKKNPLKSRSIRVTDEEWEQWRAKARRKQYTGRSAMIRVAVREL